MIEENEEVIAPVVYAFHPSTAPMLTVENERSSVRKKKSTQVCLVW